MDFHLTITSPPYFVGKEYEEDYTFADYKDLLKSVFHNTVAHTVDGGKIAINIADIAAFKKVSGRVEENISSWDLLIVSHVLRVDPRRVLHPNDSG